jgi:hypothetical protein
MNIYQFLAICGILSPMVYTAMWIIGGKIQSDYSHIRDDISSLFAVGAPNQKLMQIFIIMSSVLLFLFYLGLHQGLNDEGGSILGPLLFIISSFLGMLVAFFFPLDEGGEIITFRGKMHLILVMASGFLTIAGMIALWMRLQEVPEWSTFAQFSLISALSALVLMIIAGIFIKGKYRGLLERFGVTPFELYYFTIALMVFINN